MKKIFFLLFGLTLYSCVEEPSEVSAKEIFKMNVDGSSLEETTIIADKNKRYLLTFTLLNGVEIGDSKTVRISCRDGMIGSFTQITPTSQSIDAHVVANKISAYYSPGSIMATNSFINIDVEGRTQTFFFSILPSEPDDIFLEITPNNPDIGETIEAKVYFLKNEQNALASENLKITFEDTIVSGDIESNISFPNYSYSQIDGNFVSCSKSITTNQSAGIIKIIAKYRKSDGSDIVKSITKEFN